MVTLLQNRYTLNKISKDKLKRKTYPLKSSKNYTLIILSIFITLFICFTASNNYYIRLCSKDLSYSVNYNLTHNNSDKNLMRVKCMKLIERKNTSAIIQASGLSDSKPHKTIYVTASFKKVDDIWYLDRIY